MAASFMVRFAFLAVPTSATAQPQCYAATVSRFAKDPVLSAIYGNSDFAQVFNPSWVEASEGTSGKAGLIVRTQNCTGCGQDLDHCCSCSGTGDAASILTWSELQNEDGDVDEIPSFSHVGSESVIFGPHDDSDLRGTEDPRIAYDKKTGIYHMLYTCYGSESVEDSPTLCHATSANPTQAEGWTRLGPVGFGQNSKSGALLIQDDGNHHLYWGAGYISHTTSNDLSVWTPGSKFITGTLWGNPNVEAGPPPMRLSTGDYLFFINSWTENRSDPDWYQPSWVILSGADPSKIIAQAPEPLFNPSDQKWMLGEPPFQCNVEHVAFLEAAHPIGDDKFRIYFGGSDAVIGTAVVSFARTDSPCDPMMSALV
jgi:predicted GH43/DUF377 family glycosyl hydrolase